MNRTELFDLIRNGENSTLEFKRDDIQNHALAKGLVAFLNLEGGTVLLLARYFLADYARDLRKPSMRFSKEAEELLQQQVFPGNVRMLKNAVERAAILCGDGEVEAEDLGFDLVGSSPLSGTSSIPADSGVDHVVQSLPEEQMNLPAVERALLQEALRRTEGNQVPRGRAPGHLENGLEV